MRFVVNNKGEYYHIIEELVCPLNERKDFIILEDNDIFYWKNYNKYYTDDKLDIEMVKEYINEIDTLLWRSESRKQKNLDFMRENLSKMIAYKREIKIDEVLNKTQENEYKYLVC